MQKIYIKNNGPIHDFEMNINKYNILIGEQATGKSTIAKSVYYFRNIKTKIIDYLIQLCETGTYNNISQERLPFYKGIAHDLKDIYVKLFGYSWESDPELEMKYDFTPEAWIKVSIYEKKYVGVEFSPDIIHKMSNLRRQAMNIYKDGSHLVTGLALAQEERKRNRQIMQEKVNEIFEDSKETYYIPAGRSLLTVMSGSRATMNSTPNLDLITERFMMLIDRIRYSFTNGLRKACLYYPETDEKVDAQKIADMIVKMQKGEYFYNGGREFLKVKEGVTVMINFASSGQQELLWLLNFLYILILSQEKAFVIIEEPEAHIYPTLQRSVMEFISMFVGMRDSGVFITTHSPYIMNTANNLYYAGIVSGSGHEKQVSDVLDRSIIIKQGELEAYKLIADDHSTERYISLLDDESGEIMSALIDEVSEQINEVYTALYGISLEYE